MEVMRERTLVGLFVLIAGALLLGTVVVISGGLGGAAVSHRPTSNSRERAAGRARAVRRHDVGKVPKGPRGSWKTRRGSKSI